jgi:hypothetical protein
MRQLPPFDYLNCDIDKRSVKAVSCEEPPVEQRWMPAVTGKNLSFQGDVVRFLRSMPDRGQLLIKVYAGKAPPSESTFQLVGLDQVRRKIAAACKWPQP